MPSQALRDRAAIQVEITRLRRIEARADSSIREAISRRIRELQKQVQDQSAQTTAYKNAA